MDSSLMILIIISESISLSSTSFVSWAKSIVGIRFVRIASTFSFMMNFLSRFAPLGSWHERITETRRFTRGYPVVTVRQAQP
jgi:hypothetical protein